MPASELFETGPLEHVATISRRVTGKKPAPATTWRWCRKRLKGGTTKLDCVYHGGCWCTTEAAFIRFIERQTEAMLQPTGATDDELPASIVGRS